MPDITFGSTLGQCAEFSKDGKKQEVTVVISPLKLTEENGTTKVISGCNLWKACENRDCQFALAARPGGR
jgi:hypothetical protein